MQVTKTDIKLLPLYIIVIAILMNVCSMNRNETISDKEYKVVKTNTLIDTVEFQLAVPYSVPVEVIVPKYVTFHDTINDTIFNTLEYNNPYEDSLISGSIFSRIKTDGTLVDQQLNYIPKFPKYINRTDSIFLMKPEEKKVKLFLGIDGGVSANYILLKPKLELLTKKEVKFEVGYDIINKGYHVGISKKIKLRK